MSAALGIGTAIPARVDIESMAYSFSFSKELEQDWVWSEKYSPQPELLRYAQHVAERFDLKRDISFNTRVESAHFDEDNDQWLVTTECGRRVRARYLVMATGVLSAAKTPDIAGRDSYKGETYQTGLWPKEGLISPASGSPLSAPAHRPCNQYR